MINRTNEFARLIFVDTFGSLFWFPAWWYTIGLKKAIQWGMDGLNYRYQQYALKLWVKNFFIPMYGQYDFAGRLVSVFMRAVVIAGRSIALVLEGVVYLIVIIVWVIIPPLAFTLVIQNLVSGAFFDQTNLNQIYAGQG